MHAIEQSNNMLILYIITTVLGLVWGAVVLRRTGLFGGCLGLILLAACFGHDFFHVSLGPLPLTSDRIALAVLTVCYIAARKLGWIQAPGVDSADLLFGSFLAILTLNTFTHNWQA